MKKLLVLIMLAIGLTSCVSKKKIVYLQDIDSLNSAEINTYNDIIKKDDFLRITVSSSNMEAVAQYNKLVNTVTANDLQIGGQPSLEGYLVNPEGFIVFPEIGKIKVAGLTRIALERSIEKKLLPFVKDPSVEVRLTNFKVTVLGEVNNPGTFPVPDSRVTLLQALGLARDMTIYGKRENVLVLRDVNGKQTATKVDITSSDFIYSDFYYLQQNDTVIVEPNKAQVQAAGFNRNATLWVSIASLLLSTIVVISNSNR